ncbi:MAG TPA: hypothetical protein VKA97_10040, partial [Pyrinomonadaceae bacterium]|nr:hypothetical protein [Pyrinomonadaceae bacterium]
FREHCPFFLRVAFPTFPSFLSYSHGPSSGWSNHAQAKQQTVQCSNATVVQRRHGKCREQSETNGRLTLAVRILTDGLIGLAHLPR